jgi:hypothetical protein
MKVIADLKFPKSICVQTGSLDPNRERIIPAQIVVIKNNIEFLPYIDPLEIYLNQHNSSIGKTWDLHNDNFAKKIANYEYENIVEIGGGSGNIYKKYKLINKNINWTLIDLNPTIVDENVKVIKDKYNINYINKNDTVISSHFVEHINDIENYFVELRSKNPKYHIFSIPNFKKYAESKFCSTLMFEHPHFLTEERIEYILQKTQWRILEKNYYRDHSIFFVTEPSNHSVDIEDFNIDQSQLIIDWIDYIKRRSEDVKRIEKFYVFGAHFPYYYFLNFGVKEEQIIAVVDNDKLKCGRRMYGTNTKVIHSSDLSVNSDIVVEMGPYTHEIKDNLLGMNFI